MAAKVAFAGLGQMGRHMAFNLAKAGHAVTVSDKVPAAVTAFVERAQAAGLPVKAAPSAAAAAEGAATVFTMLPSSPHVAECYTAPGGVLDAAAPGALLVDCSTIAPETSVAVAQAAAAAGKGLAFIDAPVSGGVGGAEAGTLTFMVGGPAPAFERAAPLLKAMGKNVVHVGPRVGAGEVAKLANNLVLGASMLAVSEAMHLAVKLGVDPKVMAGILNTSSGRCWSSDTYNPVPGVMPGVPASRGYTGGFGITLMLKDLQLALEAAKAAGAPLPATSTAAQLYTLASQHPGLADKDFSAVFAFLAKQGPAGTGGAA